jgi:hypothetical protein
MKSLYLILTLTLILNPLLGQTKEEELNEEGFKTSTVSDFLQSKYNWEEQKKENAEQPKLVVENKTPFKPAEQRAAERNAAVEARLRPTLDIDNPSNPESPEEIPLDELGLDTVVLREFQVNELYSPLMRMSEMKDLDKLDPASGGIYLSEEYYSNFENRFLNRYHIPLIGKSQEKLAKERYQQERYQNFLGEVANTIEGLENLNPALSKELKRDLRDIQIQYNSINKNDDFRFNGPDAKY